MDIGTLQEMRLANSGFMKEQHYPFFWQGKPELQTREYGIRFAVRNHLLHMITPLTEGTKRMLIALLLNRARHHKHPVYLHPHNISFSRNKGQILWWDQYSSQEHTIKWVPSFYWETLMQEWGVTETYGQPAWVIMKLEKMNENEKWLLKFCCIHNFCVTNSFFWTKPRQKVSQRHPRSGHWHQLDLIITRCQSLKSILITHSYHSTDCDTDHSLVCSKIRLQSKKLHCSKKETLLCIRTCYLRDPVKTGEFLDTLQHTISHDDDHSENAAELWGSISSITYDTTIKVFGKRKRKNADWMEDFWLEMEPVIAAKRTALLKYKLCPSKQNLEDLRTTQKHCTTNC